MTDGMELLTANWRDAESRAQHTNLALVPLGAVEVYGPHMPQGTDGIVAAALCRALTERIPAIVAPLIPVGYSAALQSFPTTLSVQPEALVGYCRGIINSLMRLGARRVLLINGHAGNVQPLDSLCRELETPDRRFAQVDIWRFIQPISADVLESQEWKFGHAGEAMTSVMLYLHPQYVKMDRASKESPALPTQPLGLSYSRSYRALSPKGLLGDASLATAEKGAEIFNRTVDALQRFVNGPDFALPESSTALAS